MFFKGTTYQNLKIPEKKVTILFLFLSKKGAIL